MSHPTDDRRRKLPGEFFDRDEHELARELLGRDLVRRTDEGLLAGRIVETEVYGGRDDPASHADSGEPTERTRAMFDTPGTAYVYDIWGWFCLNITAPAGEKPAAVLIRALKPLEGLAEMKRRRESVDAGATPDGAAPTDLLDGPGKFCEAMAIDGRFDGRQLPDAELWIAPGEPVVERAEPSIIRTERIGLNPETVGEAAEWPWRYVVEGSAYASR
ncbi:MAG: DNA-3-methyladenine glycosylase [Bradymonadaceae bacterium]